jgi:hypothetical protein
VSHHRSLEVQSLIAQQERAGTRAVLILIPLIDRVCPSKPISRGHRTILRERAVKVCSLAESVRLDRECSHQEPIASQITCFEPSGLMTG